MPFDPGFLANLPSVLANIDIGGWFTGSEFLTALAGAVASILTALVSVLIGGALGV